jgi:phosphohistidine phosphatase
MNNDNKILYLVRHAKASRKYTGISDFDRPLTETGYEESYRMVKKLLKKGDLPDLIISSTAIRALSTAIIFKKILGLSESDIILMDRLYEIGVDELEQIVSDIDNSHKSVMMVGHNPAFSMLAGKLNSVISHLPTAGVAKFEFFADKWSHCSYINAENPLFITP